MRFVCSAKAKATDGKEFVCTGGISELLPSAQNKPDVFGDTLLQAATGSPRGAVAFQAILDPDVAALGECIKLWCTDSNSSGCEEGVLFHTVILVLWIRDHLILTIAGVSE